MSAIPSQTPPTVSLERPVIGILSDWNTRVLLTAAALYIFLYLAFFPPALAIMDETAYFNTAFAFRHGTFYLDEVGAPPVMGYSVGEHTVAQYPPGMSVLISLVSLFGWQAAMATNLVVHLATFAVIAAILRRIQVPPAFAILYLFFPTAVIYSRTVMSDLASGLFVALAFWGYIANRHWVSGLCLGAAVCVRTPNGIFLVLLGLAMLLESRRENGEFVNLRERILAVILLGIGAIPPMLAAFAYQAMVQGGGWTKYLGAGSFSIGYFTGQFSSYSLILSVLYPLMFLAPAFYARAGKVALRILVYGIVLLYSFYYYRDSTGSFIESAIIGLRFILVILPLFIIAYAQWLWTIYCRFVAPRVAVPVSAALSGVAALILLAGAGAIHYKHQNYLKRIAGVRDIILRTVSANDILFCNMNAAKILLPSFGRRQIYMMAMFSTEKGVWRAKTLIDKDLTPPAGRVIVARWGTSGHPETREEEQQMRTLEQNYHIRPLPPVEKVRSPEDVQLLQVFERRPVVQ